MLTGFTEEWLTSDEYNALERQAFPLLIRGLKVRIGKENAITNDNIRAALLNKYGIFIGAARMRKMINLIRNKMIIPGLVASSKGYYVTDSAEEVQRWIDSLDGRICAMMELMERAKDYLSILKSKSA
jgi:hypothetical protein